MYWVCICRSIELKAVTQSVHGRRTKNALQCDAREYSVMALCMSRPTAVHTNQNSHVNSQASLPGYLGMYLLLIIGTIIVLE